MKARQGDVLIARTEKKVEGDNVKTGKVLCARGEATGHHHTIYPQKGQVKSVETGDGQLLVQVEEKAVLKHQEHKEIPLDQGVYEVWQQREYNPVDGVRKVMD